MYDNLDSNTRVYLIYCDIDNHRHWVKETTSPDKFFSNFDKLKSALAELTYIDYKYHEPFPDKELEELCVNEQKYIQEFLKRLWVKTVSEAAKLKTDTGKANRIESFFCSLAPFKERFSKETLQMIDNAKAEKTDFTLKQNSKSEKDKLFLMETEIILDNQNIIMNNIKTNGDNYAWFYKNNYLLSSILNEKIDSEIVYDVTRLMLANVPSSDRYISLKHNITRHLAKKICLTASRLVNAHIKITEYKNSKYEKYFISTHSAPCEKCQEQMGKIYDINKAEIGTNFPPFCSHGCSVALLYSEGITQIKQRHLSYPDKLFAKAFNLYEDCEYEQAAEEGLSACTLVPESERYIRYVPKMLAKVKRYNEAVQILDKYILLTQNANESYIKQRDKYKKHIKSFEY